MFKEMSLTRTHACNSKINNIPGAPSPGRIFLAYISYFLKIKLSLCDYYAVCVPVKLGHHDT
jgi:hypothetical protein